MLRTKKIGVELFIKIAPMDSIGATSFYRCRCKILHPFVKLKYKKDSGFFIHTIGKKVRENRRTGKK